jgi:hypothetical protein
LHNAQRASWALADTGVASPTVFDTERHGPPITVVALHLEYRDRTEVSTGSTTIAAYLVNLNLQHRWTPLGRDALYSWFTPLNYVYKIIG